MPSHVHQALGGADGDTANVVDAADPTGDAAATTTTALPLPWNGGSGSMAVCRGTPPLPNRSAGTEAWPPDFAYDLDVTLPPPPPSFGPCSYADVASNRHQSLRRNVLPRGHAIGVGFVLSSDEEQAAPRL